MAPLALQITDQELQRKIQTSVLADDQKQELSTLLPQMTEAERNELAKMIDDSVRDMIEADPELQKKVRTLNEEYDLKIHELVAKQSRHVRNEFEKLGTQGDASAMQSLEGEMEHADAGPASSPATPMSSSGHSMSSSGHSMSSSGLTRGSKPKHPLLKFLFIVVALGVAAGAILFGLRLL